MWNNLFFNSQSEDVDLKDDMVKSPSNLIRMLVAPKKKKKKEGMNVRALP